jgi:hypothetical protein
LSEHLKGTKFVEDINYIAQEFDRLGKLTFDKESSPVFVKFGSARDRNPKLKIRGGQLTIEG